MIELAIVDAFTLKDLMNGGAFGLLAYIIWWGTTRLAKSIDEQTRSNDTLSKAVAALILKYKYPEADVRQEANEVIAEVEERNRNK